MKPRSATPTALLDLVRNRRVGIVLLTGIGDIVHGLPIANNLKRNDPSRMVVWGAEPTPTHVTACARQPRNETAA